MSSALVRGSGPRARTTIAGALSIRNPPAPGASPKWLRPSALATGALLLAFGCAAGFGRRPPDPTAIREAIGTSREPRFVSSRAYSHFVRALLASHRGDERAAVEDLRLAVVFDPDCAYLRVVFAEHLERAGLADKALAELLALARDAPGYAPGHLALGVLWARRQRPARAIAALERAAKLDAKEPRAWLHLAEVRLSTGEEAKAAEAIEALSRELPDEPIGYKALGRWYAERRESAAALRYLELAFRRDPGDPETLGLLAALAERQGRKAEAVGWYEKAVARSPEDPELLIGLGTLLLERGELEAARVWFNQLLALGNGESNLYARVAFAYLKAQQLDEAAELFGAAHALAPEDPTLAFFLGRALEEQERWAEAVRAFSAVDEQSELGLQAVLHRARCLSRAGRSAEATALAREAFAADPDCADCLVALAEAHRDGGELARAISLLEGAAEVSPARILGALASLYLEAGRAEEAEAVLSRGLERFPESEALRFGLAAAFEKRGELEAALGQMRALLAQDPDHAEALNFIGYALAERGRDLDEAEALVRRALELSPGNGAFLDSLGWVLFKKGDFARAVEHLETARALLPREPEVAEHLGDAYAGLARWREAQQVYRRTLEILGEATDPKRRERLERKLQEMAARADPGR